MKIIRGIAAYLKDWRNWLTHSLIGFGILGVAFFMPVKLVYRISLVVLVVTFNVIRMKLSKNKKEVEGNYESAESSN